MTESKNFDSAERSSGVRDYFQLVPKDFGVRIPPVNELLVTDEQIEEQVSILEALESAIKVDTPQTPNQKLFQCRLIKVPHYTDEGKKLFREVRKLFEKTRNTKHHPGTAHLKMTRLYEVEIDTMKTNFEATAQKIGNVRQDLWHGTKASNLLSVLKNGLIIPPANAAHCTGRMFGNGIYTSLQSTKALNYATDFWNKSGKSNQRTFMFLCEVSLGKTYKPRSFSNKLPQNTPYFNGRLSICACTKYIFSNFISNAGPRATAYRLCSSSCTHNCCSKKTRSLNPKSS